MRGVWLAIVVDNKTGDGNPGHCVKVVYPWLHETESSYWARIAVPMAGAGRGTYVLPELDDQVLVVFEHGDIHRPIVIGAVWNRKQAPVETNGSGKNNTKLIKSRSGHRIIFDDREGGEKVVIVDKTKKNKIVLDAANRTVKIESDGEIEVRAKANVIVHANAIKLGASEAVSGEAASLLTHAVKTFSVKAANAIGIGGGAVVINLTTEAATRVSGAGAGELGDAANEAGRSAGGANGRGSAGGGGGGTASVAARPAPIARTQTPDAAALRRAAIKPAHFAEVRVVDASGAPASGLAVRLTRADGVVEIARTNADGVARWEQVPPGEHKLDLAQDDARLEPS